MLKYFSVEKYYLNLEADYEVFQGSIKRDGVLLLNFVVNYLVRRVFEGLKVNAHFWDEDTLLIYVEQRDDPEVKFEQIEIQFESKEDALLFWNGLHRQTQAGTPVPA